MKEETKSKVVTLKLEEGDYNWLLEEAKKQDRSIGGTMRFIFRDYRDRRDASKRR